MNGHRFRRTINPCASLVGDCSLIFTAKALVWVASCGREVDLTPDAHRYFFDRYSRLATFYRARAKTGTARRYQSKADTHYVPGGIDGPRYAAAMAMARPRTLIRTNAIGTRNLHGPDDAA